MRALGLVVAVLVANLWEQAKFRKTAARCVGLHLSRPVSLRLNEHSIWVMLGLERLVIQGHWIKCYKRNTEA